MLTPARIIGLAALVCSFVLGYLAAPKAAARVEERVVEVEKVVEKRVEVKVAAEAKRVVVYRERVVQPDGTRVEREIERADTVTKVEVKMNTETKRDTKRDVERVEVARPDWRVGVLAGVDARQVSLVPLSPGPLVFGGIVERRLVGPVSVGAWGLSSATFGVSVSVEF